MKRISVETLREMNACEDQIELFEKFLGGKKYVLPIQKTIEQAALFGLDIIWAIDTDLIENYTGSFVNYHGTKYWYLNGKRHREDGPAVEWPSGAKEWYLNGKRHREDGPSVEYSNGDKEWYLNGKRYREDGPSREWANGSKLR